MIKYIKKYFFVFLILLSLPILANESENINDLALIPINYSEVIRKDSKFNEDFGKEEFEIGIKEVLNFAEKQNLDILSSYYEAEASKGAYWSSFGSLLPSMTLQSSREDFQGGEIITFAQPVSLDRITYRHMSMISYRMPLGGKTFFRVLAGKNDYDYNLAQYSSTSQKVIAQALMDYFSWYKDMAEIMLAEQSIKETEEQLKAITARVKSGFGTKLELMQTQSLLLERQNTKLEAQKKEKLSQKTLINDLNLGPNFRLKPKISEMSPLLFLDTEENILDDFIEEAYNNRPDLLALDQEIKYNKNLYRQVRSDLLPNVSLSAYYRRIGQEKNYKELDESTQNMISIDWDLMKSFGPETIGAIKSYKDKVKQSETNRDKQINEIERTVSEAFYNVRLFKEQMEVDHKKILAAEEAYRLADVRMKSGFGLNLDLIKAQTDLTKARFDYTNSIIEYNKAQIRLLYESGLINSKDILEISMWGE